MNSEATVGEFAWCWARLPYRISRGDGTFREVRTANLTWQVHPDRPEWLRGILDWYDDVAGDVVRDVTVQSSDAPAQAMVAARGFTFDAAAGAPEDGSWVALNMRELDAIAEPMPPRATGSSLRRRSRPLPRWPRTATHGTRPPSPRRRSTACGRPGRTGPTCMCWLRHPKARWPPPRSCGWTRRRRPPRSSPSARTGVSAAEAWEPRFSCTACTRPGRPARAACWCPAWVRRRTRPRAMYAGVGFCPLTRDLPYVRPAR